MHVFLTGATGFLGSAIIPELLKAGHTVLGLARSDAGAEKLTKAGASVLRGTLDETSVLAQGAASSDGVIHAGFIHDFKDYAAACATDKAAIEALASALEGSGKPLVITSGTLGMPQGRLAFEDDVIDSATGRVLSENTAIAFAERGVRVSVVRLPPSVHGEGDGGFVASMIKVAREKGFAAYVGNGLNVWSTVHRLDAAKLFRLALENGEAGSKFHGVAEEGVPLKDIAGVIGQHLNVPVVSKSPAEAGEIFGFIGMVIPLDNPVSSEKTQTRLGWHPEQASLLADMEEYYFKN